VQPSEPTPVKLVCGVLHSDEEILEKARELLIQKYGPIDYKTQPFPFDITDYYVPEMGSPIYRLFYSFRELINPKELARIKIECNEIEDEIAVDGQRKVNLDPGYMDYDKFVLASAKYNAHKVYLDFGIWADLTLMFKHGKLVPSDFAFPDFKTGIYEKEILMIRAQYKGQVRKINREKRGRDEHSPASTKSN
jgi:hypothetical protein